MQYPAIYAVLCVWVVVIVSAIVVLSWWKVGERRSQKIDNEYSCFSDFPVFHTLAMLSSKLVLLLMKTLYNGDSSQRPSTNLIQIFWVSHLNVALVLGPSLHMAFYCTPWYGVRRLPQSINCFWKQRVNIQCKVGQGFVSKNARRNIRGRVQGATVSTLD